MKKPQHKELIMSRLIKLAKQAVFLLLLCSNTAVAQNIKSHKWEYVVMDSTWNTTPSKLKSTEIIAKYKPKVDELMKPIGKTQMKMDKFAPESPLSNWSVDVILKYAQKYMEDNNLPGKVDISMLNFGGIRTSLPNGEITPYDILSIFPFDNRVVILNIQGKFLKGLFENFAKRERVEALGGVEIKINKQRLEKLLIGGEPIDEEKFYNVATIDFLMNGSDNVYGLKNHRSVIETNTLMRDVVIEYVKAETAAGHTIKGEKDGRAIIIKEKE